MIVFSLSWLTNVVNLFQAIDRKCLTHDAYVFGDCLTLLLKPEVIFR